MGGWRALVDPAHMQGRGVEVDLVPAQVDKLSDPQVIGHQQHGGVAAAVAVALGGLQ
jgi:hypothetical protein